jgi:hypothetical protein
VVTLSPEQRSVVRLEAQRELCRRSFPDFLTYCQILSDDPLNPQALAWQPWDYLQERAEAWDARQSEVVLKARQLGFSWMIAAYMLKRAMYDGWQIAYLSKGQAEARKQMRRVSYLYKHLPSHLRERGDVLVDDAKFASGGIITALPSTEDAGIGDTLQLAVMDEAAFHPYGTSNYAAIRPATSAGGQVIINSTADPTLGPAGFFHDMYWDSKRGETPYTAVFVPWHARPGRDAAWLATERAAYKGLSDMFDAYYPETDAAAFVGRSGLVYPMFDALVHVAEKPCDWAAVKRKVGGVDWGGGDPTAAGVLGMTAKEHVHQYAEFYERGPVSVPEIAAFFGRWPGPGFIECDPSEPVAIETLRKALNGTGWIAEAADNRREEGLGLTAFLLDHNRLTIDPTCTSSIAEFRGYRWRERVDPSSRDRYATSTPVDNHADAMDMRRYALMRLLGPLAWTNPAEIMRRSVSGRPVARKMW